MLELFSSGLVSLWLNLAGVPQAEDPIHFAAWDDSPWLVLPSQPDPIAQTTLAQYLKRLSDKALAPASQGIWLQSGPLVLASNQGTTPLPAASLTKVATSLVSLHTWGPDHQFVTQLSATGPVENGVLQGDLVIQAGGDPLLVWEEAIALGNALNRAGVSKIAGNLVITGNFLMNFETDPTKAGALFKQAIDSSHWSDEAEYQYRTLPKGTERPQVTIGGSIQHATQNAALPPKQILLVRHRSLPLSQILKLMNLYSNNVVAESLATSLGGAAVVAQQASLLAGIPQQEILLKNGSGLGTENQLSPRAVCAMFAALQRDLQRQGLTLADLFAVAGIDRGTIEDRKIPHAAVVKTGTLNQVSALAGVLPTHDHGLVWFAIINRGTDLEDLRHQQDGLLQALTQHWGAPRLPPIGLTPSSTHTALLGDSQRNQAVQTAVEVNTF